MTDFRNERVGLINACRILRVPAAELKAAIHKDELLRGVTPPKPIVRAGESGNNMLFRGGDVMDCAEAIKGESE